MSKRYIAMLCIVVGALSTIVGGSPAGAQEDDPDDVVEVIEVSGLIDPVVVVFVEESIREAEEEDLTAIVLRMNSGGAVVDDEQIVDLARLMRSSTVPVGIWVGESGAQARGAAAQLVAVAQPGGISIGSRIGDAGEQILPVDEFGVLWGDRAAQVQSTFIRSEDASDFGVVDAPTLGDFIVNLEGVRTREVQQGDQIRLEPVTRVRFVELSLTDQLFHSVASPNLAYLLFAVGLALLVFEFYTAGVGIAGAVGALCVVLGCYGLGVLPTRWWAIALLVASFIAFSVDVQTSVPRTWTGIGFVAFAVGSFALFDGVAISWITLVVVFAGIAVTYLSGMPSMVRTRFSTPTIGREWMIGEMGLALSAIDPDGTVSVRSAPWRARTNRATAIGAGDRIRVTSVEGLVLEVEPEEGGAKDYRR